LKTGDAKMNSAGIPIGRRKAVSLFTALTLTLATLPLAGRALADPTEFKEAPMLAALTKAGTLPPVKDRLPAARPARCTPPRASSAMPAA
jgi:hypothetical protein